MVFRNKRQQYYRHYFISMPSIKKSSIKKHSIKKTFYSQTFLTTLNSILAKQFQFCYLQFYNIITQDNIHLVKRIEKKIKIKHYEQIYIQT